MKDILQKLADVDFYIRWYVSQAGAGRWPSLFRGAGLEFEKITRYDFGEDPRWINWAATARTGGLQVLKNTLVEEHALQVFLVVDLSASMDFGTRRASKRRVAAEVAAILTHAAWRAGDSVGFAGFTSTVQAYWPPRPSPEYRLRIPAAILGSRPRPGERAELACVLGRLPERRSLLFAVSDFQEDLARLEPVVKTLAFHHDLVPILIEDPRERSLPDGSGVIQVQDLETGARAAIWLDRKIREGWSAAQRRREAALTSLFKRTGVDFLRVDPTTDSLKEIAGFFLRRRWMRR